MDFVKKLIDKGSLEKEEYVDPNLAKTLKKVEELSSKRVNKCRL